MSVFKKISSNKLIGQFFSLASIQGINLLIPLFVIPYVSRILGPDRLGIVNFATSFLAYFTLIINYGFDYSATREISINKGDKVKLNDIINVTLACKFLLFIISSALYFIIIFSSKKYSDESPLYLSSYLLLISAVFYSTWLFQGFQSLSFYTSSNLVLRVISLVFIFFMVKHKEDYVIFQTINGLALFITAISTLIFAKYKFEITFNVVGLPIIWAKLKDSFVLFCSVVIVNFNTTSTIVLLGYLTSYSVVGYYSASMKVYSVIGSLSLFPLGQVVFPHLSQKFNESVESGLAFVRRMIPRVIGLFSLITLATIFLSKFIIHVLYGNRFEESIVLLQVLAPLLLISTIVNIICYQVMLNLKMDKYFLKINGIASIINIIVTLILVPKYKAYGTCISLYIIESAIIIISLYVLKKNGIKLFKFL